MIPPEVFIEELRNNLKNNGFGAKEANGMSGSKANVMATPANSGDEIRSIPNSGFRHGFFSHNAQVNSGCCSKKIPFSASKNSGNGLEPVAEDLPWQHYPNSKLAELFKRGFTQHRIVFQRSSSKRSTTNSTLSHHQ